MEKFVVEQESFAGPLDLLLHLAETKKIDVLSISIVRLVESYLEYLSQLNSFNIDEVGDFLEIAVKLILMKLRFILGDEESEDESAEDINECDITEDIKRYTPYRKAVKLLIEKLDVHSRRYKRGDVNQKELILEVGDIYLLGVLWYKRLSLKRFRAKNKTQLSEDALLRSYIYEKEDIQEYINRLKAFMSEHKEVSLKNILTEFGNKKMVVVVVFIALLELLRKGFCVFYRKQGADEIYFKLVC